MKFSYLKFAGVLVMLPLMILYGGPNKNDSNDKSLRKTEGVPSYTRFNINNISTFIKNDGESDINPNGNSGFTFPKGSNKQAIFQAGFLWGGIVNGQKRVGGSVYRQGTVPGKILNSGVPTNQLTAESPDAANVRNYRVRPDYKTGSLSSEIADGEGTEAEIRAQYEKDWNEWPAADGAPYNDVDGNGSYDPAVDIPGVPGADQTIWFVCNDTDPGQTTFMYGSPPMGIEEQVTIWGYNTTGALGNMLFRKFKIINKSNTQFDSMFVSMWNDPDNGDASDDYVGCDTTLSLTFCYNGRGNDASYGNTPPATGFDFFQGPIVEGEPTDSAIFNGKIVYGKKNLPMTAHYFFINGSNTYTDPPQGIYDGTLQWFNLFNGAVSTTGETFVDPVSGEPTKFALAGDPLTSQGWVDGIIAGPDDRRAGMASGPFTMAPGDTQEIVVAEIAAGAFPPVDRLGAVGLLKFYDLQAQLVYDNFFIVPKAAPAPQVSVAGATVTDNIYYTPLNNEIVLNWGNDLDAARATESYSSNGFEFQGYNIYQLPSSAATIAQAERVATFDKIDGIGKIIGLDFDLETGVVIDKVLQFGSDNGIQRSISIKNDVLNGGLPLVNGTRYYFAVTSYSYNPDPEAVPNVLENPISIFTIVPQSPNPGVNIPTESGQGLEITHNGTANADVNVTVIDPTKLTGHEYELFFDQQSYYLDSDGKWKETNFPDSIGKHLGKDVSPSSMSGVGVYAENAGTIDLKMSIDLVSPDFDYVDGVKLTFPAGVTINSAADVTACANGNVETPVINGQEIMWGNNDITTFGCFDGSQVLEVNVSSFTTPLTIDYVLYDDGYGASDTTINGTVVDATGSFQITKIGNQFVTQNRWNIRDVTTGQVVLPGQTIFGGTDIYANVTGPGGSATPALGTDLPPQSNPIFDGLQLDITGSFEAPINWNSTTFTPADNSNTLFGEGTTPTPGAIVMSNYTVFGGTITSKAIDNFGVGTNELEQLQQDYELRFTGIEDTSVVGGQTIIKVVSGGQMATVFQFGDGFAAHPLNTTGTDAPFLIRIPFEVWNISDPDNPRQVNITFRDRLQTAADNPFYGWNDENRMYALIVNSDYDESKPIQVNDGPDADNALATWALVFWSTHWNVGDKLVIEYANPLQIGKDTYSFTAPSVTQSSQQAVEDVKNINVFPNPYYGVNPQELNKYQRFVTFNHLPQKATIRIFNLAGQLVRTIEKNSSDQFQRWDLLTDSGLPVASGLFIVYVDMPDLGTTKVLKAAIIQEEQILDRF